MHIHAFSLPGFRPSTMRDAIERTTATKPWLRVRRASACTTEVSGHSISKRHTVSIDVAVRSVFRDIGAHAHALNAAGRGRDTKHALRPRLASVQAMLVIYTAQAKIT